MEFEAGQVAVVTGAAQGIGRAFAEELAERGLSVVVGDIDGERAAAVAGELSVSGGAVHAGVGVDVADSAAMLRWAEEVVDRFGRVDVLVNNAGVVLDGGTPLWEADVARWHRVVEVNLLGVLHGVRAFVPHLVAAGRGQVIMMASLAGLAGTPMSASYGVSKHGVVALAETLHAELEMAGSPIGVTVACPAFVRTPMVAETVEMAQSPEWQERVSSDAAGMLAAMEESLREMLEPTEAVRRVLAAAEAGTLHLLPNGDVAQGARNRALRVLSAIQTAE